MEAGLLVSLFLLWFAIICILFDIYVGFLVPGWPYYISTFGVLLWIAGVIFLLYTFQKIFRVDQVCFRLTCCLGKGPGVDRSFERFDTSFSKDGETPTCIDEEIGHANNKPAAAEREKNFRYPVYPVILAADESWRPWEIAEDFALNALGAGAGVIWFSFARAAPEIAPGGESRGEVSGVRRIRKNERKSCQAWSISTVSIPVRTSPKMPIKNAGSSNAKSASPSLRSRNGSTGGGAVFPWTMCCMRTPGTG